MIVERFAYDEFVEGFYADKIAGMSEDIQGVITHSKSANLTGEIPDVRAQIMEAYLDEAEDLDIDRLMVTMSVEVLGGVASMLSIERAAKVLYPWGMRIALDSDGDNNQTHIHFESSLASVRNHPRFTSEITAVTDSSTQLRISADFAKSTGWQNLTEDEIRSLLDPRVLWSLASCSLDFAKKALGYS
jgi:hypothetical protein